MKEKRGRFSSASCGNFGSRGKGGGGRGSGGVHVKERKASELAEHRSRGVKAIRRNTLAGHRSVGRSGLLLAGSVCCSAVRSELGSSSLGAATTLLRTLLFQPFLHAPFDVRMFPPTDRPHARPARSSSISVLHPVVPSSTTYLARRRRSKLSFSPIKRCPFTFGPPRPLAGLEQHAAEPCLGRPALDSRSSLASKRMCRDSGRRTRSRANLSGRACLLGGPGHGEVFQRNGTSSFELGSM